MTLLSLETSSDLCSVALQKDGKLTYNSTLTARRSQSEKLAGMIQGAFDASSTQASELEGVVVGSGPGSYTGLRIGVSTAKGLCMALGIPLFSVGSLHSQAIQIRSLCNTGDNILSLRHARNDEYYAMTFTVEPDGLSERMATGILTHQDLNRLFKPSDTVWIVGFENEQDSEFRVHGRRVSSSLAASSAVGALVWLQLHGYEVSKVDLASFEPYYVRDFQLGPSKQNPFDQPVFQTSD